MTGRTISPIKLIVAHSFKKMAPLFRTQTLFELTLGHYPETDTPVHISPDLY